MLCCGYLLIITGIFLVYFSDVLAFWTPKPVNEDFAPNVDGNIEPSPNRCRLDGGSACCNCLYHNDIEQRYHAAWEKYRNQKAFIQSQRDAMKKMPRITLLKPYQIDFLHFEHFQADEAQDFGSTKDERETFRIVCWNTLSNKELMPLLVAWNKRRSERLYNLSRKTRTFRIQCHKQEKIDYYQEAPRLRWVKTRSNGPASIVKSMFTARCLPLNDADWTAHLKNKLELRDETVRRESEMINTHRHRSQWQRKRDRSLFEASEFAQSRMLVGPGNANRCLSRATPILSEAQASEQMPRQIPFGTQRAWSLQLHADSNRDAELAQFEHPLRTEDTTFWNSIGSDLFDSRVQPAMNIASVDFRVLLKNVHDGTFRTIGLATAAQSIVVPESAWSIPLQHDSVGEQSIYSLQACVSMRESTPESVLYADLIAYMKPN